jgi:thymidylate kinase
MEALAPAPAILDRWLYSNRAYSTVFDNQAAVPFWRCEMAADKEHPLVVFMHCPVETLLDRMRKRNKVLTPHNVNDPKMLKSLVERFDEIESGCGLPKVGVWSDGSMPLEAVMARVLSEVNR